MKKTCLFCLTIVSILLINFSLSSSGQSLGKLQYKEYNFSQALIHTLLIPADSNFLVTIDISPQLETIGEFTEKNKALAVLNGGFFDPKNQQTTSWIIKQGEVLASPLDNERLINNPQLAPYLEKILNRSELRRYVCGEKTIYDITLHNQTIAPNCQLIDVLGGGPSLLPEITAIEEGFIDYSQGKKIRDVLGSEKGNARSAVGITNLGDIIWVMVQENPEGLSLKQLADFLSSLGVEKALNLDGGSSAAMYYQGETFWGKLDGEGNSIQRPIKSVLLVKG